MSSVLIDVGLYKDKIMSHLLKSTDLCKVLLRKDEYTDDEADELIYNQLFQYLYIDDTQTEVKSFVCFEIDVRVNGNIKTMTLTSYIYSHKECMKNNLKGYSGTTVDILSDIFERQIGSCIKDFGIGKWDLDSTWHTFPNNNYYGKTLSFTTSDFKMKEGKNH